MDEKQQALLSYLLGKGLQQEERVSHVMKQPDYRMGQARSIPVPTHAELQAQREKAAAAKKEAAAPPPSFTPMQWSSLRQAASQPAGQPQQARQGQPPVTQLQPMQKPQPMTQPQPKAQPAPQPRAVSPALPFTPQPKSKQAPGKITAPVWEKVKRK